MLKRVKAIGADTDRTGSALPIGEMHDILRNVFYASHKFDMPLYKACAKLYPDFLFHYTDQYMAALVQAVSNREQPKNVFVLCGKGQSRSIPHYLAGKTPPLEEILVGRRQFSAYSSLLHTDTDQI